MPYTLEAVLLPIDGCSFVKCSMDIGAYTIDVAFLKAVGNGIVGTIPCLDCRFIECFFDGVSFAGDDAIFSELRNNLSGRAL